MSLEALHSCFEVHVQGQSIPWVEQKSCMVWFESRRSFSTRLAPTKLVPWSLHIEVGLLAINLRYEGEIRDKFQMNGHRHEDAHIGLHRTTFETQSNILEDDVRCDSFSGIIWGFGLGAWRYTLSDYRSDGSVSSKQFRNREEETSSDPPCSGNLTRGCFESSITGCRLL